MLVIRVVGRKLDLRAAPMRIECAGTAACYNPHLRGAGKRRRWLYDDRRRYIRCRLALIRDGMARGLAIAVIAGYRGRARNVLLQHNRQFAILVFIDREHAAHLIDITDRSEEHTSELQ